MTKIESEDAVKVQSVLHQIKVIIETQHGGDASGLLGYEGWYLLGVGVAHNYIDEEARFMYTLGCTRDRSEWDNWERNF